MRHLHVSRLLLAVGLSLAAALPARALYMEFAGGPEPISLQEAAQYDWPKGTLALVNHKLRINRWYGVWSGHPNDARSFNYRVESTDDANRLLEGLGAITAPRRRLILNSDKEFRSTLSPKIAGDASFVIGSKKITDQYYSGRARGEAVLRDFKRLFGPMDPTLTLYFGSGRIDVNKLQVPEDVEIKVINPRPAKSDPKVYAELEAFAAARKVPKQDGAALRGSLWRRHVDDHRRLAGPHGPRLARVFGTDAVRRRSAGQLVLLRLCVTSPYAVRLAAIL